MKETRRDGESYNSLEKRLRKTYTKTGLASQLYEFLGEETHRTKEGFIKRAVSHFTTTYLVEALAQVIIAEENEEVRTNDLQ